LRRSVSPAEAPAILGTAAGIPALITAVTLIIPRVVRSWGGHARDTGAGDASEVAGRAAIIRAEGEGEAAIILAKAALHRADAEFVRAERGLTPLPPALSPDEPPALPPTSSNGSAPEGESPQPQA